MKLNITKSKSAITLYVSKSYRYNGKSTSKNIEKLGTYDELKIKLGGEDPIEWAKNYIKELTKQEKEENKKIVVDYSPSTLIGKDTRRSFNGGYLFLQQIYHELGLDKICKTITKKHEFEYNLDSVLSRLVYGRILHPKSKLATMELSKRFIEQPDFDIQHIYRSLSVLAEESDYIQSQLFKNSLKTMDRNTGAIYYDCTNFFFEIDEAEGLKQYGISKEHRPNPIVQMGLFMDADGLPLAFCINPGNTNEQVTMRPLEEKLDRDFGLSKFIVCTDGGLSSKDNREYNNRGDRAYITTQSLKKFKEHLKEWSLDPNGWRTNKKDSSGNLAKATININELDPDIDYGDTIFYKDRWINEDGLEQHLIVTYSTKYRDYHRSLRSRHIEKATSAITSGSARLNKKRSTDYKRFITEERITKDGEIASKSILDLDTKKIEEESKYDGFYAVCTNLEDNPLEIIRVNKQRWEIEDAFRTMKSEFKARPVFLQRDDRIKAHFITCFISLMIFKTLEKKLENEYTCNKIIRTLSDMNFYLIKGDGYVPCYTRCDLTDKLHELYQFRTDTQIVTNSNIKKIISLTKKNKKV